MKFIIAETGWQYLERLAYRGAIGLFYQSTLGGLAAYLIFGIICILSVIGLITVIKFLIGGTWARRKRRGETDGEYWLRTGKTK